MSALTASRANIPTRINDPINAAVLAVSEDRVPGFHSDPIGEIARLSEIEPDIVIERIRAMLEAGAIRRVRQTLLATNLAEGALVAWQFPADKLDAAFDYLYEQDPFSGHVVIRSTDTASTPGARYRLWTTLKVPQGYSLDRYANFLRDKTGAERYRLMPARYLFALGVGHVRRQNLAIGSKADVPAEAVATETVSLTDREWQVLVSLKREFAPNEIVRDLWSARAEEAGVHLDEFLAVGRALNERGVIGRFSTFLEHVKPTGGEQRVTRYNALFHWAVPPGRELEAGREIGRFHIMTHAYWREAGPEFNNVNIMGVAHGLDKDVILQHKAAMDSHLAEVGIDVAYTNVFWGGRSEIKPSEISPLAFCDFCRKNGIDPESMQ
jgi:DNA-binding Lrp family transcriptional regulator